MPAAGSCFPDHSSPAPAAKNSKRKREVLEKLEVFFTDFRMSEKPATLYVHLQVGAYGVMRLARRLRNDGDFSVWSGAVSPRLSEVSRGERDRERRVSVVCLSPPAPSARS